jgi:hypothetical protein
MEGYWKNPHLQQPLELLRQVPGELYGAILESIYLPARLLE